MPANVVDWFKAQAGLDGETGGTAWIDLFIGNRCLFAKDGEAKLRREVEKEAQQEANRQRSDAKEPVQTAWQQREAEAKRAWTEYEVERAKQAVTEREGEWRRKEIKRAKRAALRENLVKIPVAMTDVIVNVSYG